MALVAQRVELVEHDLLGAAIDHERPVAAAAPRAGLDRPLARWSGRRPASRAGRRPRAGRRRASLRRVPSGWRSSPTYAVRRGARPRSVASRLSVSAVTHASAAAAGARGGRHRQDAGARGALRLARRAGLPARADRCSLRRRRRAPTRRGRGSSAGSSAGYDELFVLTPASWRRCSCGAAGPGRRPARARARRRRPAGDAARADRRAVARAPRLRRQRHALLGGFIRRIDRLKARADRRRGLRALGGAPGRVRGRPVDDADSSASSPRSTAPTSGCWPRPAPATPATSSATRCGWRSERPAVAQRFEHVLVDDAQELDLAPATLARAVGGARADRRGRSRPGRSAVRALCELRRRGQAQRAHARLQPCACPRRGAARRRQRQLGAGARARPRGEPRARSPSGAAPTSARRRRRWRPTSSA